MDRDNSETIDFEEFTRILRDIENQSPADKEQELIEAFNVSFSPVFIVW